MTIKQMILFGAAIGLSLTFAGCGGNSADKADAVEKAAPGENAAPVDDKADASETTLNLNDAKSPEGVVQAFFQSFFRGDDQGAFALLTSKAQTATRDDFSAQASDTIKWNITKKTVAENGRTYVFVDVEDYTDAGEIQTEELTFALSDADSEWRVAGFVVGGVAINFEERQINAVAQENQEPQQAETNVKVGQNADGVVR